MVRISKQPEERRSELLETADRLFMEKGFAFVRVSDIVSAMGVAQGTFYYYFKSKDEILIALLEQKWSQIASFISEKVSAQCDSVVRLSTALAWMIMPDESIKSDPCYRLLADPAVTGVFHPDFDRARVKSLLPVMISVIEYGIHEGAFPRFLNTEEVVKLIFLGISSYFHQVETDKLQTAIPVVLEMLEHVLGLSAGTLKFSIL